MISEIFNNREIALLFWLGIIVISIFLLPKLRDVRKSVKPLIASFFQWKLQVVLLFMLSYILVVVYFLTRWGLWDFSQLKNTIVWTLSIGFLSIFQVMSIKKKTRFFKRLILDNLKFIAILEFVIGLYAFSIYVELVLLPILTFVGLMVAYAGRNEKYRQVETVLNGFLALFGLFLLANAIYRAITDTDSVLNQQNFYDFVTPPFLTLLYLPFLFALLVFASYENILVTLPRFIQQKKKRGFAIVVTMIFFNVRVDLLKRWRNNLPQEDTDNYKGLWHSILNIFKLRALEKNPPLVPIEQGWSPYIAKDVLTVYGLETGHYKESYGDWIACSRMMEVTDGLYASNIAYYVEGNESAATTLKLVLNVNKSETEIPSQKSLHEVAVPLYKYAVNENLPNWLSNAILNREPVKRKIGGYIIEVEEYLFKNSAFNGYDIKFSITLGEKE